jgi:predicted dehydrogenase
MTPPFRFAVVGCGYITQAEHVPGFLNLLPEVEVTATADPDLDRARAVAAPFRANAYPDLTSLLGAELVDAVFIASRAPTHARLIAEAAAAGKPILVEKPVAYSLAEARAAIAAVDKAAVKCLVAYHRRYDDDCLQVKKLIDEGAIGEVRAAVSQCRLVFPSIYRSYAAVAPSPVPEPVQDLPSDWLTENSIHHLNLLRFWLGEVAEVHSAVYQASDHNLGTVTLEFEHQVLVSHHQLRGMECGEEITVYGTRGNIRVELWYPHRPYRFPRVTHFTVDPPGWREIAFPRTSPYTNEIAHFVRVVREGAANRSDLRDSYRDLEILKQILDRAVYLGRTRQ